MDEHTLGPRLVDALLIRVEKIEQGIAISEPRVRELLTRMRAEEEAKRRLAEEAYEPPVLPTPMSLRERLLQPREVIQWRIEGWQPVNSRVMLAAQMKAGKTSFVGNLLRSLADGDAWLDVAAINCVPGVITVLDTEMSSGMIENWLADQQIVNDDKVNLITLRGQVGLFNIIDPKIRTLWAELLTGTSYLILDCLRPCFDALGLNEDKDAGKFLVAFDALLKEAGIAEAMIVQHMGHANERSRGDSRLRDWPDVEWRLVRENDNPSSARFITAFGRDVSIDEAALHWDPVNRHLTLHEGSRKDAATHRALPSVLKVLELATEGMSGRAIHDAMSESGHPRAAIKDAIKIGISRGLILVDPVKGPKNSNLHTLNRECSSGPDVDGTQTRLSTELTVPVCQTLKRVALHTTDIAVGPRLVDLI